MPNKKPMDINELIKSYSNQIIDYHKQGKTGVTPTASVKATPTPAPAPVSSPAPEPQPVSSPAPEASVKAAPVSSGSTAPPSVPTEKTMHIAIPKRPLGSRTPLRAPFMAVDEPLADIGDAYTNGNTDNTVPPQSGSNLPSPTPLPKPTPLPQASPLPEATPLPKPTPLPKASPIPPPTPLPKPTPLPIATKSPSNTPEQKPAPSAPIPAAPRPGSRSMDVLTDSLGRPQADNNNSLTVGINGPTLLEDVFQIDKLAHFNRERIPERVVHAKGAGAFGFFEAYQSMGEHTFASFLSEPGKRTKTFVRFSTVIGGRGSADTVRDPRGFAVKFYTDQGIYDIVGNDLPVFFIRDSIKFPDVIHALKPSPDNNLRIPERFWDFISLTPESMHMITWLYSDRGTIKSYKHVDGFGVNTYIWVNKKGDRKLIKYHWKTMQGLETITRQEAEEQAGKNPDIAVQDLYESIARGENVRYELAVQMMTPEQAARLPFDPLDDTKTWSETDYPLMKVGMLTLNKNPDNFFAQVEQAAFCPGNVVPGIELSADKMLQGRSFAYLDAQRYRIGPNFADLPVNRSISPVDNNQRDGFMTYTYNPSPINYSPNSLNDNRPEPATLPNVGGEFIEGNIGRTPIVRGDDFTQASEHYRTFDEIQRNRLADNIAVELVTCNSEIKSRVLRLLDKVSAELGAKVRQYMDAFVGE